MNNQNPNEGARRRRVDRYADPMQNEPSMSAPSPMPGKPAASYVKPQPAELQPQAEWNPPQESKTYPVQNQWNNQRYPAQQGYANYPVQSYPAPSQGVPAQVPPAQYGAWQQGYQPVQQTYQQPYQQPSGRGWNQPYPAQNQSSQNQWQGGYTVNQWNGNGYSPVYEESVQDSFGGGSGGGNGGGNDEGGHSGDEGKQPISRENLIKLIAAIAAVVIVVVLAVGMVSHQSAVNALHAQVEAYENLYCQGVYVDGIHLGGMTREQAHEAVQKNAQLKCDEWHVRLETSIGEYVGEINSYHLGMTVHVDDALEEAWRQGHTGQTAQERKAEMDALLTSPYTVSTALPSSDTAAIDSILNEIAMNIYLAPVDAACYFDPEKTNPFEITDEANGRYLNVESIKAQVYDMVSRMEKGVILIEPTTLYPTYTRAYWESRTALIASAYTPISSTSEEGRNKNIERACDLINGSIIEPGKTFSFNGIVGPRTKNNGFHKAIEYAYSQQVEGYGGGVCQVSSTIYWAAVRANMEIVKREQHSLKVGYTTFGFDATVNYDGRKIDFVFRNNTESPIYVITKVVRRPKVDKDHNLVLCEIYGVPHEEGVTYDIVAVQTEVPIPEATVVPDKKAEHVIYTDESFTQPGAVGYEVDSYKVKYVNGAEVERTFLYHDTYKAVQPVTYVGVSERPLDLMEP